MADEEVQALPVPTIPENNPYAGPDATGAFSLDAMGANNAVATTLQQFSQENADNKDAANNEPEPDPEVMVLNEALATKLKDDAKARADALSEEDANGPFTPESMAANNELAENLIEDAQESADEKDGTDPIDPPVPPEPEPFEPVTVAIGAFTAENPTRVTVASTIGLFAGDVMMLNNAASSIPESVEAVDGKSGVVADIDGTGFTLSIDLTGVDVTDLSAVGVTQEPVEET